MRQKGIPQNWLIADTHWYHSMLVEQGHRPADYDMQIFNNWLSLVRPEDTIVHLGDVIFAQHSRLHEILCELPGFKILVRGNHDHESDGWYRRNGFAFVCHGMTLGGVYLSHHPALTLPSGAILNVHGHLHGKGNTHRGDPRLLPKHCKLLAMEDTDYKPVELTAFVGFTPVYRKLMGEVFEPVEKEQDAK